MRFFYRRSDVYPLYRRVYSQVVVRHMVRIFLHGFSSVEGKTTSSCLRLGVFRLPLFYPSLAVNIWQYWYQIIFFRFFFFFLCIMYYLFPFYRSFFFLSFCPFFLSRFFHFFFSLFFLVFFLSFSMYLGCCCSVRIYVCIYVRYVCCARAFRIQYGCTPLHYLLSISFQQ